MTTSIRSRTTLVSLLVALFVGTQAAPTSAQEQSQGSAEAQQESANVAANSKVVTAASDSSKVVRLSPFVVNTERDTGYAAFTTLAGTRLNSELSDIGTSVSVITEQFLRDTGATDTKSLLVYTTGTEVAALGGNFSAASIGNSVNGETLTSPSPTTRVRGLAAASEARNFFTTQIPLDSYNLDRVEINRGANSVLFGTGSPAGIINSSLKQALMVNRCQIEDRYGSYGTSRITFDINQQIVPGELAVRIDGLYQRQNFQQNYAFQDDKRIYGALTYAPRWARTKSGVLSGTVLRATLECGERDSEQPRLIPPTDAITTWFKVPSFASYPPKFSWNAATQTFSSPIDFSSNAPNMTFPASRNPNVWFNDPTSDAPGFGYSVNGVPIVGGQGVASNYTNPTGTHFLESMNVLSAMATAAHDPNASFYLGYNLTDESVFDFRHHLLEGPNRHEYSNFSDTAVSIEQRFFGDRAGIQLDYDKQHMPYGNCSLTITNGELCIDPNTVLINGVANPNFGRPFIVGSWQEDYTKTEARTRRATAYYRFDFADVVNKGLAKWLGTHTITLLDNDVKSSTWAISGRRYNAPAYTYGNNNYVTDIAGGIIGQVMYLGPSLADATTASGAHLTGVTAMQVPTSTVSQNFQFRAQAVNSPWVVTPLYIADNGLIPYNTATSASKGSIEAKAKVAVLQSKFLQNTVVATYGWRRDQVDTYTAAAPHVRGTFNNLVLDPGSWPDPATPTTANADDTVTKSLVLHTPRKLLDYLPIINRYINRFSLRYNTSENFTTGATRYDSYLSTLTPPTGKTKDRGLSVSLFDDRVVLNVTWYETSQNHVTARANSTLTQQIIIGYAKFVNMTGQGRNPNASQVIAPPDYLLNAYGFTVTNGSAAYITRNDIVLTQDYVSKGVEFEAQLNPTKHWRMTLNATQQKAVTTNTGPSFYKLFFVDKFNGQTLAENWTGPAGKTSFTDESGGTLALLTQGGIINPYYTSALQDGGPVQELRRWRANAVTSYDFHNSFLKGFGVGAAIRWQDKVAIGFPTTTVNGLLVSDVRHPFYGPDETNVDGWVSYKRQLLKGKVLLTLQLSVYNLMNNRKLVPVTTQPDGSIALYRIPADRNYAFTTRFNF